LPIFRGLIGPIPEGKNIIRYESPDVFEDLTKQWSAAPLPKRRRNRTRLDASHARAEGSKSAPTANPDLDASGSSVGVDSSEKVER